MRKTLLNTLLASALASVGSANAALQFDLNGGVPGGLITANSFDWAPTSFLAKGGNAAIDNFILNGIDSGTRVTSFDVLTHAKMTAYIDGNGISQTLPVGFGEITVVSRFTERVTSVGASSAEFATTGAGWVEMYYSSTAGAGNSRNLTGSGFDDGKVIMRAEGVGDAAGAFFVTSMTPVQLDQSAANNDASNDYRGQMTVKGFGSQESISFGSTKIVLDSNFFHTAVIDFSILFSNISIGLAYTSVDPSDCFNPNQGSASDAAITGGVVNTNTTAQCIDSHVNGVAGSGAGGKYVDQAADGGYLAVLGDTNGLSSLAGAGGGPDFIAQTDFNSPVTGVVPEPGMLALLGLAFAGLGLTTARRRKV